MPGTFVFAAMCPRLCAFVFCVGFDIGLDMDTASRRRAGGPGIGGGLDSGVGLDTACRR